MTNQSSMHTKQFVHDSRTLWLWVIVSSYVGLRSLRLICWWGLGCESAQILIKPPAFAVFESAEASRIANKRAGKSQAMCGLMLRVQYTRAINSIPIDQITGDWIIRESDKHYFEDL